MCSQGHEKDDHNCQNFVEWQLNSYGANTEAKLIACNEAFLTAGVPVSTLIGDGDSSMLAAQRESQHSHLFPYFGLYFFFHYAGVGRGYTTRGEVQLPVYANNLFGA